MAGSLGGLPGLGLGYDTWHWLSQHLLKPGWEKPSLTSLFQQGVGHCWSWTMATLDSRHSQPLDPDEALS